MKRLTLALLLLCFSTLVADAANRFGRCTTTCTWDNSSTAMWSTTSGGATGASAPTTTDAVTLDANTCVGGTTCTITVNANLAITSLTMGACTATTTGCILDFSVNNNNVTITPSVSGFIDNGGSGTRTLKMGSGTFTIPADPTGAGQNAQWTTSFASNLTFLPGTSTILYNGNTSGTTSAFNRRLFTGGSLTYATLTIAADTGPGGVEFVDTGNTFSTLNIAAPNSIYFKFGSTTTVTNAINWSGTSSNFLYLTNNAQSATLPAVIAQGAANATIAWAGMYGMTMTGAGTHTATNTLDFGANTGFSVTPPASIPTTGGGTRTCILGGWLLWRDMPEHINDNFPAWLEKAA